MKGRVDWVGGGTELRARSLVVIALAFSVNVTAPRRPAAGFAATGQISRPDFQGRRAGAQSHCTVSPTFSVLSPKLALHPKSTIQILNPPKISKFCSDHHRHFSLVHPPLPPFSTTTTTTRFGHLVVISSLLSSQLRPCRRSSTFTC